LKKINSINIFRISVSGGMEHAMDLVINEEVEMLHQGTKINGL